MGDGSPPRGHQRQSEDNWASVMTPVIHARPLTGGARQAQGQHQAIMAEAVVLEAGVEMSAVPSRKLNADQLALSSPSSGGASTMI